MTWLVRCSSSWEMEMGPSRPGVPLLPNMPCMSLLAISMATALSTWSWDKINIRPPMFTLVRRREHLFVGP
jgi:hypothetical protein